MSLPSRQQGDLENLQEWRDEKLTARDRVELWWLEGKLSRPHYERLIEDITSTEQGRTKVWGIDDQDEGQAEAAHNEHYLNS